MGLKPTQKEVRYTSRGALVSASMSMPECVHWQCSARDRAKQYLIYRGGGAQTPDFYKGFTTGLFTNLLMVFDGVLFCIVDLVSFL